MTENETLSLDSYKIEDPHDEVESIQDGIDNRVKTDSEHFSDVLGKKEYIPRDKISEEMSTEVPLDKTEADIITEDIV